MFKTFTNRIAAAVHTLLNKQPMRLSAKDIDIIVERVARIKENPLQSVDVSVKPNGHFDADAARELIKAHAGQGNTMHPMRSPRRDGFPGTHMTVKPSEAQQWPCRGNADAINSQAFAPRELRQDQAEFVSEMPADAELPPLLTSGTGTDQLDASVNWFCEAVAFEEALSRGIALVLAGRLPAPWVSKTLRGSFQGQMGVQQKIGRWLSPAGLGEIAAARMNTKPMPVEKLERMAKRGTLQTAEQMNQLVAERGFAVLADRLPVVVNRELPLEGVTFVLTGGLPHDSRDDAKARVEALGGVVAGAVNRHPIILVRGIGVSPAAAKLQKAWFFNHPVISPERFDALLAEREAIQGQARRVEQVCTAATSQSTLAQPGR